MSPQPWTGGFVQQALGVRVRTDQARSLMPVESLVGLALRRNPKRAHLLVSRVLAKHVPTDPSLAIAAGELLGLLVSERLSDAPGISGEPTANARALARHLSEFLGPQGQAGSPDRLRETVEATRTSHPDAVTIGYAETATGLGQLVADTLGSYYIHSTRHAVDGAPSFAGFEEGHSHATSHRLLPTDGGWLKPNGTVVLVDDELSTGSTVINTIRALQTLVPQAVYVVAALVDLRTAADRERISRLAAELHTRIAVVSLATGEIELPANVLERAGELLESLPAPVDAATAPAPVSVVRVDAGLISPVRSARFGTQAAASPGSATVIAEELRAALAADPAPPHGREILVLGTEEFIALPLAVADRLHRHTAASTAPPTASPPHEVKFSTTTRSPIAALDRADYAIASSVSFDSHDGAADGPGIRFAHNLSRSGRRFDAIVLMPEPGTELGAVTGPGSVTEALSRVCGRVVVVLLPVSTPSAAEWSTCTP